VSQENRPLSHAIDPNVPSVARMYDYLLGGTNNYAADRDACVQLLDIVPSTRELSLQNRAFLVRAVRLLAEKGIRQFLDFGSGLPTQNNVHQVAQAVDRSCRVVYIDNDPIVLGHGRMLLDENDETSVIQADMTDTATIFSHPDVKHLIREDQPTAVLFNSVFHCLKDDDDPAGLVRRVAGKMPEGSYVLICQLVSDRPQVAEAVTKLMADVTGDRWGRVRSKAEVREFFTGLDVIDPPGLCEVSGWLPDSEVIARQAQFEWEEWGGVASIPPGYH
jgi:hypothetical protein